MRSCEPVLVQGVVAADGDEDVDAERVDRAEDRRGEVVGAVAADLIAEEVGHVLGLDPSRVGAARVEEGASAAVDGADRGPIERQYVLGERLRVVRVAVEQAAPPTPYPDDLAVVVDHAVDRGFDAGVESGDIAPAGEDRNTHVLMFADPSTRAPDHQPLVDPG
jgi:hypothetical protein